MHPEVRMGKPGQCPKCGMTLVPKESADHQGREMHEHAMGSVGQAPFEVHAMPTADSSWWDRLRMSMTMTMGMEHTGLAGRETARLMEEDIRNKFFFALVLSLPIIAYSDLGKSMLGLDLPSPIPVPMLLFLLSTPVFLYSGWIFLYSSYKALSERKLNMAVLIAVGITAAYASSIMLTILGSKDTFYDSSAMLITFVLFGHWMEMKSRRGTTDALQALFSLLPPSARLVRNGKETMVATSEVRIGDIIMLKPGDRVPVDGEIVEGETAIDESLITGESLPVAKKSGDAVVAGSINQSGSVRFRATKVGADTALAQIVKMVETAQNSKAPGQRLADRFAGYLVILAIGSGAITFIAWYVLAKADFIQALTFSISAIVIACPDALGLATPTAVAVGTGLAAKHNILIKDAASLERISKIQAVVMDKTGTLTEGRPRVTDVVAVAGFSKDKVVGMIAAAESKSAHPLSKAMLDEAENRNVEIPSQVERFSDIPGKGVEAGIAGSNVIVGTPRLMEERGIDLSPLKKEIDVFLEDGKTIMVLASDGKARGVVAVADELKPTAKAAVARMRQLGLEVVMITGDNRKTAEKVAGALGIIRVFSEVQPADKARYVKQLQDEGRFVAMVGDGVNDAPALAQADIGVAIGAGTDVAIETAKVVLMKSDPADVLRAIRLSKATVEKMKQNLAWASVYNIFAIPVAAGVLYPAYGISLRPEVSALLMSVSSIIVATNAMLLSRAEKDLVGI